jgi:hypothetical protein
MATMSVSDNSVLFEGELNRERVKRLFAHRSLTDRALMMGAWVGATAVVFVFAWLMGAGDKIPAAVCWVVSGVVAIAIFVFGLLQQFAAWHTRRWYRWNGLLDGPYRVKLADGFLDVQTSSIACRLPYRLMAMVDSGLSCVRIGLDAQACRALLLPISDGRPQQSVKEFEAFVKERIQEGKNKLAPVLEVPNADFPLPFDMADDASRIEISGPLRQGQLLETLEASDEGKQGHVTGRLYILIGVCFVILLGLLTSGAIAGREIRVDRWLQLGGLAIVLLLIAVGSLRLRWAKADIRAEPDAEAAHLRGWISPLGVVAHYRYGCTAITWKACDHVEVNDDQILIRFWYGDFILVARHMFPDDSDFERAVMWSCAAIDAS